MRRLPWAFFRRLKPRLGAARAALKRGGHRLRLEPRAVERQMNDRAGPVREGGVHAIEHEPMAERPIGQRGGDDAPRTSRDEKAVLMTGDANYKDMYVKSRRGPLSAGTQAPEFTFRSSQTNG